MGKSSHKHGDTELRQVRHSQIGVLVLLLVVVGGCVVVAHWRGLSAQASSFDDEQYLHKNKLVQEPGWNSTWRFLSEVLTPSTVGGYYQPLAMISLMADYAMGGRPDNLLPFHITSLCLHVLNTWLIIVLLYVLFGKVWPAVIVGLLFGVHPMTVEPIPWVAERKTLLASFFALWSMILYIRYARSNSRGLFAGCVVMYVLALMSKPTTTPLPLLLLLLDFWPLRRLRKQAVVEKVPLFIIMVVFGIITVISQGRTASVTMPTEYGPARIPLILCHNIVFYLYKIIWPVKLSSHYPLPLHLSLSDPMVLAGVIGTCILLAALLLSLRWTRALVTGWLFFFVAILPTMQIIGFTNVIASDKYAYFPSVGFLMVLAWGLVQLWPDICGSAGRRIVTSVVIVVLSVSECLATRRYLLKWQDSEGLYRYMLARAPDAPSLHLNLANIVLKQDRFDEAIAHYKKAIAVAPGYRHAHFNLGIALAAAKRYSEAIEEYDIVLQSKPDHWEAISRLAYALAQNGQPDRAISYYNKALEHRPEDVELLNNLALALVKKGQIEEAIKLYNKSLVIKPDSIEVLNNLGNAFSSLGRFGEAVECYEKILVLKADFAEAHYNLGNALRRMKKADEAVGHYQEALRLRPDDADSYYGLGLAMVELKEYEQAAEQLLKAVQVNRRFAQGYYQLGLLYYSQDRVDEAIEQFRQVLDIHPKDAEMHCNLGVLLAEKDDVEEAVKEFRTALRLDPQLSRARKRLEACLADKGTSSPH